MKVTPLKKQSKKEQRKFHARKRRDWNGLKPPPESSRARRSMTAKGSQSPKKNEAVLIQK